MNCGHCARNDPEVDSAHVLECSQFPTIEDLERVLAEPAPAMRSCSIA